MFDWQEKMKETWQGISRDGTPPLVTTGMRSPCGVTAPRCGAPATQSITYSATGERLRGHRRALPQEDAPSHGAPPATRHPPTPARAEWIEKRAHHLSKRSRAIG